MMETSTVKPFVVKLKAETPELVNKVVEKQQAREVPPPPPPPTLPHPSVPPALDFRSVMFNPTLALATPGLEPPQPRAKALDNLNKFRHAGLLPPHDEHAKNPTVRQPRSAESIAAQKRAIERAATFKEQDRRYYSARVPIITALSEKCAANGGPLSLLLKAMTTRRRIRVVTRHASGVRGTAVAYLLAFDKYMNLILQDVTETYTVRLMRRREVGMSNGMSMSNGNGNGMGTGSRTRCAPVLEHRRRHVQQVFLRGEQIVLVSMAIDD